MSDRWTGTTVDSLIDDDAEVSSTGNIVDSIRDEFIATDTFHSYHGMSCMLGTQWRHHNLYTAPTTASA